MSDARMRGLPLAPHEQHVVDLVASRTDELVALLQDLIAFDTTTRAGGDEAALQSLLAERLARAGATIDLREPEPSLVEGHPYIPDGFTFEGRPQLVATFGGSGGGRKLILNGHVDVVGVEPRDEWLHDPRVGVVADGRVHGRGACDMKGGVAAMVIAAETVAAAGLGGDLVVATVTEEESTGAGGLALARMLEADAAIVTEPTALDVAVACRGSLLPSLIVQGRGGHAGLPLRPPEEGGSVNAIEKTAHLLAAIESLREHWSRRPAHPYLSAPDCVPTMIAGGEWIVSYPARCRLDCHIEYLPGQDDAAEEFTEWMLAAAARDPWLAEHPPVVEWLVGAVPAAEVALDDPVVTELVASARDVGAAGRVVGFDNWHDGATLTAEAGIPAICFGPGDIRLAHSTAESVPIDELVRCAQALAVAAIRYCG
jgi:acetylornithine deacetylase